MAEGEADQDPTIYWTLIGFSFLLQVGAVGLGMWAGLFDGGSRQWALFLGMAAAYGACHVAILADRIKRRTKKPAP